MLETLLDYPVATAGLVTAPSGIGTMFRMLIAGRIIGKVDLRLTLFAGFMLTAFSLWQMAHYSLDLSQRDIIWPGVIQGIWHGTSVRSIERCDLRHSKPGDARAGHGLDQPDSQHRQQYRHFTAANHVGAQHRHCT